MADRQTNWQKGRQVGMQAGRQANRQTGREIDRQTETDRLRRLWSDDSDIFHKSESMCHFFEKRGYPASIVQVGHHRAQLIDRQSSLQTSQKQHSDRIPFTLTFHPHKHSVKSIILKNFKLLQNDPETSTIFSQPPLISFKRDKNIGNFLVRSSF